MGISEWASSEEGPGRETRHGFVTVFQYVTVKNCPTEARGWLVFCLCQGEGSRPQGQSCRSMGLVLGKVPVR